MSGIILPGQASSPLPCAACRGPLTPTHRHQYVDSEIFEHMRQIIEAVTLTGCIGITQTGDVVCIHYPLKEGFTWAPVPIELLEKVTALNQEIASSENVNA